MKRFTATEKWQKDWFQSLSPGQKCLWNYLCDNCDAAGVWEPNWRLASFVINETFTTASLAVFGERVRILPDGKIWLTGFCEFQYSHLSRDCRPHINIIRILEKHGLLHEVENLLSPSPDNLSDTLWHRVADRDKEKDKDKEQDSEGFVPNIEPPSDPAPTSLAAEFLGRPRLGDGPSDENGMGYPGMGSQPALVEVRTAAPAARAGRTPERTPELAALGQRVGAIMRRRPGSRWSEREISALGALFPLAEDDLLLIERYYGADIASGDDFRRRDLLTLLNHWSGEVDRARAFWRKRGWRVPCGEGGGGDGGGEMAAAEVGFPEGFAAWKAQTPEYGKVVWRDWTSVPEFARGEFHRWRKGR